MRRPISFVLAVLAGLFLARTAGALTATPTRTPTPTPIPTEEPGVLSFEPGTVYTVPGNVAALASADFNLDQLPDVALASAQARNVTIMLGDGLGGFTQLVSSDPFGLGPIDIDAADLNGDGVADVVVADPRNAGME
ncbi:MAG TPA: VCBS repeat-containing protein, partial [Candidatus Kryptonia bacterium]|nr:VCBS repeat-containing protein [Candidatus Kryptonia bacterium]